MKGEKQEQYNNPESKETIRITAGGVIFNVEGRVLMVQDRISGGWFFPKGGAEKDEDIYETALREIREESSLEPEDLDLKGELPVYERKHIDKPKVTQQIHMFHFLSRKMEVGPSPEFRDEIMEAKWIKPEDVVGLLTAPKDREFFLGILKEIGK